MDWISVAQTELKRQQAAGWLIYDFRGTNPVAKRFLSLGGGFLSRRVFLFVPPEGTPTLLVHAIEKGSLPDVPFDVKSYSSRQTLLESLQRMVPQGRLLVETSPMNDIPYVSHVDAGTVDLLRSLGAEVMSSADLLQAFSTLSDEQVDMHLEAAKHVVRAKNTAFEFISLHSQMQRTIRETDVQKAITGYFDSHGLIYDHPPIVGFGPHASDPHYAPQAGSDAILQHNDVILIDLWAKLPREDAPYADITWMACYGEPSDDLKTVFEIVRDARDLAVNKIKEAFTAQRLPEGHEIDRAVRSFIESKGFGEAFFHRTGHSIGTAHVHGEAVHLDDFETHDTRKLIPGVAITVEPGIYLNDFGVRSEINLVIEENGPRVTTEEQQELIIIPISHKRS